MVFEEGSPSVPTSPVEFLSYLQLSPGLGSPYLWLKELKSEDRGLYLVRLLHACANYVASGSIKGADAGLQYVSHLASPDGDALQRIATYFSEALSHRMIKHMPGLFMALTSPNMFSIHEKLHVHKLFFDLCPFLKLAYVITNRAIVEAMDKEKMVHIIDLNASEPAQWIDLLHTLATRPEGPPHLRITGIHEHKEVLDQMAAHLTTEAENLNIPFQFYPIVSKLENLDIECLRVKTGEALAIISILQLHYLLASDDEPFQRNSPVASLHLPKAVHMNQRTLADFIKMDMMSSYATSPDSALSPLSFSASPKMGSFLTALWKLRPILMVVAEQEADLNNSNFPERAKEALNFYGALFDCLDSTVSRTSMERKMVEKMLLGEELKNIIACEGAERKERHEKLEKWIIRLELAGFEKVPLSCKGMLLATGLLRSYGFDKYKLKEKNGCSVICWHDEPLFSVSAWRFRSYN